VTQRDRHRLLPRPACGERRRGEGNTLWPNDAANSDRKCVSYYPPDNPLNAFLASVQCVQRCNAIHSAWARASLCRRHPAACWAALLGRVWPPAVRRKLPVPRRTSLPIAANQRVFSANQTLTEPWIHKLSEGPCVARPFTPSELMTLWQSLLFVLTASNQACVAEQVENFCRHAAQQPFQTTHLIRDSTASSGPISMPRSRPTA
jgi:hypothetical protein